MKEQNFDLFVATYANAEDAQRDLRELESILGEDFKVDAAVAIRRDKNGKMSVIEDAKQASKGTRVSTGAGFAVGLLSPPLLEDTPLGPGIKTALGTLTRRYEERRLGVELREHFPPNSAAVAVVVKDRYLDRVHASMKHADKHISRTIDSTDYETLWKALEKSGSEISTIVKT